MGDTEIVGDVVRDAEGVCVADEVWESVDDWEAVGVNVCEPVG